jgi:hypothetical protein
MFTLKTQVAYWWPVIWNGASAEEPGAVIENRLDVKFRRKDRSDLKALFGDELERAKGQSPLDLRFGDPERDREIVDQLVDGWRGLFDEDGRNELPFADPYIGQMIELPGFMHGLVLAYFKFVGGVEETRRGNSNGSPAGGPATDPKPEAAAPASANAGTSAPAR